MQSKYDVIFEHADIEKIKKEYVAGLSTRELCKKYNIKSRNWLLDKLSSIIRNTSDSRKMTHKMHPESYKHSDESKRKIRDARLKFMKEHPGETGWRKRNKPSYPELCFINYLKSRGYDKTCDIEREKSFFPYYVDFAFNEHNIAVEIDGSQHITDPNRFESDRKKDELLNKLGWKVIRYSEQVVKEDWGLIDQTLILKDKDKINQTFRFGIYRMPKSGYKKVERDSDGKTKKERERAFKSRKCIWPTKEELIELNNKYSKVKIGKMFGVSDNAVRKWLKYYDINYK